MDYIISVKFIRKNECSPLNVNKIIDCIAPSYRGGHKQTTMVKAMYPSKTYKISFGDNNDIAEKFRVDLFINHGDLLQITKNY